MSRRKVCLALIVAVVVGACCVGRVIAQPAGQPPAGMGRRFDQEEIRRRIEEWRGREQVRLQEALGADEDEWKVLQPRIEKVSELLRNSRVGRRPMMGQFGRPGGGPRDEGEGAPEQTDVEKATETLRKVLEDKESKPNAIKAALGTLREAREKARDELAEARKQLREVITTRQEAQLVLMGLLE